mmetsp:Transcript_14101/g.29244  ORF Transcript_14101/g.29244 Transcript_14101/m.29244 type:complete len:238 (-) Transcript_14101:214-927(-)
MRQTLLSRAITADDWSSAIEVLKCCPEQASWWSQRFGFFDGKTTARVLPLHEALVGHAPLECIKAIVEKYPEGVKKPESSYQRLPLHCACRKEADPCIIYYLAHKCKKACVVPDALGRVPLHYALTNGADAAVVHTLLDFDPSSARSMDRYGWTPVHVACSVGASVDIVERLLEINPEAVLIRTARGGSLRSVIPPNCPNGEELRALIEKTRPRVEAKIHLPLLRWKSFNASRMVMT